MISAFLATPVAAIEVNTTTLTTSLSSSTITAGDSFNDMATLSGGTTTASGLIGFWYSMSDTCPGTGGIMLTSVSVSGNGVYSSGTQTISTPGTYYLYAIYGGDENNFGSTSACEKLTVNPATSVPQFPAGILVLIGLALPALTLMRRYEGIESPTV